MTKNKQKSPIFSTFIYCIMALRHILADRDPVCTFFFTPPRIPRIKNLLMNNKFILIKNKLTGASCKCTWTRETQGKPDFKKCC